MKSEEQIEFRAYIKARVALQVSAKEIYAELCRVHGSSAVTLRMFFRWAKKFKGGKLSIKEGNRPGRSVVAATKEMIDAVKAMVDEDGRYTV